MKKLSVLLICGGSFVGVAGIAVGSVFLNSYLNRTKETIDITAPDGLNIDQNHTSINMVAFVRNSSAKESPIVHWYHDDIPFGYIDFLPNENGLELDLIKNYFGDTSHFHIWAIDGGVTSNKLTVSLLPETQKINLSYAGGDTLSSQNDTVTIKADFALNTPTTTQWQYALPGDVEKISEGNNNITFRATKDITKDSSFVVTATKDDVSSQITIFTKPPTTIIDLSFFVDSQGQENHILSFKNTRVTIIAKVQHQGNGSIDWEYTLPATLTDDYINITRTSSAITFIMKKDMPTSIASNSFFAVTCKCNEASSSKNIILDKPDTSGARAPISLEEISPRQEVIGADGIVYQNNEFVPGAHSVKCPAWKSGYLIYVPKIYNDSGTEVAISTSGINADEITYDSIPDTPNPSGFTFTKITDSASGYYGGVQIVWDADSWSVDNYQTCVLRFNLECTTSGKDGFGGDIQNSIILNIDFGNLTGVKIDTSTPTTFTSVSGTATYAGEAIGKGVLDDKYYNLDWKLEKVGTFDDSALNISGVKSDHNNQTYQVHWDYSGFADLTAHYKIILSSAIDENLPTDTKDLTIVARQTNGVQIKAPDKVNCNITKQGSITLQSVYTGANPSTNTEWSITNYDGANPSGFTFVPDLGQDTVLSWNTNAMDVAKDYSITIQAQNKDNASVLVTKTIVFHNRGIPTDINISGGTSEGPVTATVVGPNVDQGVNFSLRITGSSGKATKVTLANITSSSCFIYCEGQGLGYGTVQWNLTVTTNNNGGDPVSKTISGSYSWNNYE